MFDRVLSPFLNGNDIAHNQNRLGMYIGLSIWMVSFVFCFYYFAMGVEPIKLLALAALSIVGALSTRFYYVGKNTLAVISQCFFMYVSLLIVLSMPVVGRYPMMCILIIALTPIVQLNKMRSTIVFGNLIVTVAILTIFEVFLELSPNILEQILDYFIKLMVIIFVFCQALLLRVLLERKSHH